MKTSNKLLVLLIILVFVIPFLVGLSFQKSIRNDDYRLRKFGNQIIHRGKYKPYKTVMITAPMTDVLTCYLRPSDPDSLYYSYTTYHGRESPDSVNVYNSGDTLYIQYVGGKRVTNFENGRRTGEQIDYTKVNVYLYMPVFDDIVVETGTIRIDSLGRSARVSLTNLGEFYLAREGTRTVKKVITETKTGESVSVDSTYSGNFNKITITGDNGRFFIGANAWVRRLQLNLRGTSVLSINDHARIDTIAGYLSNQTSVRAHPKNVTRLESLFPKASVL